MTHTDEHITKTPLEARQASSSKDTFAILIVSTIGAAIALLAIWAAFQL